MLKQWRGRQIEAFVLGFCFYCNYNTNFDAIFYKFIGNQFGILLGQKLCFKLYICQFSTMPRQLLSQAFLINQNINQTYFYKQIILYSLQKLTQSNSYFTNAFLYILQSPIASTIHLSIFTRYSSHPYLLTPKSIPYLQPLTLTSTICILNSFYPHKFYKFRQHIRNIRVNCICQYSDDNINKMSIGNLQLESNNLEHFNMLPVESYNDESSDMFGVQGINLEEKDERVSEKISKSLSSLSSVQSASTVVVPPPQQKNNKETNPNLLKNLVASLRIWVKIPKSKETPETVSLWEHFLRNKKINHQLIKDVFGTAEQVPAYSKQLKQLINREKLDSQRIQLAQECIRKETIGQLYKNDPEYIIQNRRVKDKQSFREYFYGFLEHIKEGGIPKSNRNFLKNRE